MDDSRLNDMPPNEAQASQPQPAEDTVQPAIMRISMGHLTKHLLGFFALEHGLLRTIRELVLRPGATIRSYLFTNQRANLTNPVGLALLTAGLTVFLMVKTGSVDTLVERGLETGKEVGDTSGEKPALDADQEALNAVLGTEDLSSLITDYYNIILLATIPMWSMLSMLFFRKDKFYYAEHLVVNTYITGIQNVLYMPIAPFLGKVPELSLVYLGTSMLYQIWVYMTVFSGTRWQRFWRAAITFGLGMVLYSILIGVLVFFMLMLFTSII